MATATITNTQDETGDQCVELRDVDWKGYLTLLRLRGDRPSPRMVYLDGTLWLMSPTYRHEWLKKRLGWVVEVIVEELDIPCIPTASTTFRRRVKRGGVEGDQTYYLANRERVAGKRNLTLKTDPPPDLAIEAVNTHSADAALEVYRRFKVPEVWVASESELAILVPQPNRRYAASSKSAAFPFLSADEVRDWVLRPATGNETDWLKGFRSWVKNILKPRVHRSDQNSN